MDRLYAVMTSEDTHAKTPFWMKTGVHSVWIRHPFLSARIIIKLNKLRRGKQLFLWKVLDITPLHLMVPIMWKPKCARIVPNILEHNVQPLLRFVVWIVKVRIVYDVQVLRGGILQPVLALDHERDDKGRRKCVATNQK